MIDDLLRPIGPGPRPPADGFARAVRAGRRKRWRTLRNNAACMTAAFAAIVAAVMPRLSTTSFAGLEPTTPVIGTHPAPHGAAAASPTPTPSPSPESPAPQQVSDRDARDPDGPAGYARPGYAPAASRGPAGPQAYGTTAPDDDGSPVPPDDEPEPEPAPAPSPPATQPAEPPPPSPSPSPPPEDPGPEPIDLSYEDQPVGATCQGSTWCWSAHASGSYTFRLKACRGASDTSGILKFTGENEADFRVLRDGATVWQWSVAHDDPAYVHDVYVDRWQCAVWTTRWHGFDQAGDPVPPGTYRMDALSHATNVATRWWGTSFTVS